MAYAIPVGFCGPDHSLKQWRPETLEDLNNQIHEMIYCFMRFGLKFLFEYQTVTSLVQGYLNGDQRFFVKDKTFVVRVVAAALCTKQNNIAKEIAGRELGTLLGIRRRYAILFERLNALTGGASVEK